MPNKSNKSELEKLKTENEQLRSELARVSNKEDKKFHINGRAIISWFSLALAGALFVVGSLVFYIVMTLVNTDRFMSVVTPLAQQPAVQAAVAQKTTDALFKQVDVEQLAVDILPDQADFLAPEISKQIQKSAQSEAQKVIASDTFQQVWQTSMRTAHQRFISALREYQGDGSIDISDVYNKLSNRLEDGKFKFLANKTLPPKIGNITVVNADWLPTAHKIVAYANTVRILTIVIFLGLLGIFIWLATDRRRAIINIGAMISSLSLALLISIRIAREMAIAQVNPQYQAAATEAWRVFAKPFAIQLVGTLLFGLAVVLVAWLGGTSRSSLAVRRRVDALLSGKLHQSIFSGGENKFSLWVGKYKKALLVIIAVIFVLSFLTISLTFGSILMVLILSLTGVMLVEALAGGLEKPANKTQAKNSNSKSKSNR